MYTMILSCLIKEFKIITRRFWNFAGASQKPKSKRKYSNWPSGVAKEKYLVWSRWILIWWKSSLKSRSVKIDLLPKWARQSSIIGNGYFCFLILLLSGRRSHSLNVPFFFSNRNDLRAIWRRTDLNYIPG